MNEVDIGLVGYGRWGKNIAKAIRNCESVNLRFVIDKDRERADQAREKFNLKGGRRGVVSTDISHIRKDVYNAVVIATPADTHSTLCLDALEAYKHVLVEKPFTISSNNAENIIACAKAHGVKLSVGHVYRHAPEVEYIKNNLDKLGDIKYARSDWLGWDYRERTNIIWDLAVHPLSIYRYLFECEPEVKDVKVYDNHREGDESLLELEYDDIRVDIRLSWAYLQKRRKTVLSGSHGSVVYQDTVKDVDWYDRDRNYEDGRHFTEYSLDREIENFAQSILQDEEPKVMGQDGLAVVKTLEEIDEFI